MPIKAFVTKAEYERLKAENERLREALQTIRYRYFPVEDKARLEWAKQTFEIAREALSPSTEGQQDG